MHLTANRDASPDRRPRRAVVTAACLAAAGLAVAAALTGCVDAADPAAADPAAAGTPAGSASTNPAGHGRQPPEGPVRNDLEPLVTRCPGLGTPVAAAWQSGLITDPRVPGPNAYWVDAVVTLHPSTAADLRQTPSLTVVPSPELEPDLRPYQPAGNLWTSDELADALGVEHVAGQPRPGWRCRGYLSADSDVVVLLVTSSD